MTSVAADLAFGSRTSKALTTTASAVFLMSEVPLQASMANPLMYQGGDFPRTSKPKPC